ncbi:MAG: DUF2807 domain-containing protein [Saprospiraceae bacterium]|nr:DUF2807 domain-containing protein [Saprospiraceae bacterium]
MKNVLFFLLLLSFQLQAQINGNGNIVTKSFSIDQVQHLEINLNARILVDLKGEDLVTITTDENLIDQIDFSVSQGYMNLQQKEWIQPSSNLRVVIGASALRQLTNDAHSKTTLLDMDQATFQLTANIGTIDLQGQIDHLMINNKSAKIEAIDFEAKHAEISIRSWGTVFINVKDTLTTSIDQKGQLKILGRPSVLRGDAEAVLAKASNPIEKNTRYINLKIRNNSWWRKSFVVKGPKRDGTSFSYGFALLPGQTKSERWTIGSEVFRVKNGQQTLVATIEAKDENKLVQLFE